MVEFEVPAPAGADEAGGATWPPHSHDYAPLANLTNPATPYTREALGEAGRPAVQPAPPAGEHPTKINKQGSRSTRL